MGGELNFGFVHTVMHRVLVTKILLMSLLHEKGLSVSSASAVFSLHGSMLVRIMVYEVIVL